MDFRNALLKELPQVPVSSTVVHSENAPRKPTEVTMKNKSLISASSRNQPTGKSTYRKQVTRHQIQRPIPTNGLYCKQIFHVLVVGQSVPRLLFPCSLCYPTVSASPAFGTGNMIL
ncbi:hypothetical protein POM88_014361 [Heracleum sosnowskyi]|uniref:Uncharacterized protein n=1 Tax=Heracleum sosnowskyi TaxID=360622 RepID=A0AAD8J3X8_9APIA|nr:hypothetical protein POM88_014361 [Heracleum sosnowskyi]